MTTTTDPLNALLGIRDGNIAARWNFDDAVGSTLSAPAGIGHAVSLSYSFPTTTPSYYGAGAISGFTAFSTAGQQGARDVLDMASTVARISFTEVSGVGTLTFGMNSQPVAGYAYLPGYSYTYSGSTIMSATALGSAGDVWLNRNNGWTSADYEAGGAGQGLLVHELGHALGLKHPFESSAKGYTLDPALDHTGWTVMSYDAHPNGLLRTVTDNGGGSYSVRYRHIEPETFMPYDIVALQHLYGKNTSYRSGNDTYTFDPTKPFIKTIYDAGGIDTVSVANFARGSVIDLRDGHFSSIRILSDALPAGWTEHNAGIYDGTDNLAIAFGVVLENAVGGSGNDSLTGNAVANLLNGGRGADTLLGGAGNDTYVVDNLGDKVYETTTLGGTTNAGGTDTVRSSVSYTLGSFVEKLVLTGSAAINGTGNSLANSLTGNAAANTLNGGGGNDTLASGAGNDTLVGGAGSDRLTGGSGGDRFVFNTKLGSDTITDFVTGVDKLGFSQAGLKLGDGDTVVEGATVRSAPGGFSTSSEVVIFSANLGSLTASAAAAAIGSATSAYAVGKSALFAVDNGVSSALYLFSAADSNAVVSASELSLLATLNGTSSTAAADYLFLS